MTESTPGPKPKRDHKGSKNPNTKPVLDRIMSKITIDPATGCEVWDPPKGKGTFFGDIPRIWLNGRYHRAADILWDCRNGPRPPDERLMKLCETHLCVSPDHHMLINT